MNNVRGGSSGRRLAALLAVLSLGTAASQSADSMAWSQLQGCFKLSGEALKKCLNTPPKRLGKPGIVCKVLDKGFCNTPVFGLKDLGQGNWQVSYVRLRPDFTFAGNKLYSVQIPTVSVNLGIGLKSFSSEDAQLISALSKQEIEILNIVPLTSDGWAGNIYFRYLP